MIEELGPNLGKPYVSGFGSGLYEIRAKGKEGIVPCPIPLANSQDLFSWANDSLSIRYRLSKVPLGIEKHKVSIGIAREQKLFGSLNQHRR